MLLRLVFVLFASAFVSLIVLADRGQIGQLWAFVGMVPLGDKLGHVGLVGTLTVLLNLQLKRRKAGPLMLGSLIVLAGMMMEEGSQFFIPVRSFDGFDALANLVGVLCAEGLVRMLPSGVTKRDRAPLSPAAEAPASCGAP
jgi:glycopeptide antibiotics resistance protein